MRRFLSKWRNVDDRKVQAIVCMCAIAFLGVVFKPAPKSNADSLDPIQNQPEQQQATSTARNLQRQEQIRQVRPDNYDLDRFPITSTNERHWRHLLWTTAVVEPDEPFVAEALNHILSLTVQRGLSDPQTRTVDMAMKVATQLYLSNPSLYGLVGQRFLETIEQSADPEWVAVSLSGLAKGKMSAGELQRLGNRVKIRFPNWATNASLKTTLQEIKDLSSFEDFPPLKDLLSWNIAPRQLHLYVFCRPDRRILCRTILKDRNGDFVQQDGKFWSVSLLLESIHELGWNFTRGQTPQGIFRIEGVVPQPDEEFFRAYGQFPLVNLFVPFEPGAKAFLPNQSGPFMGSLGNYQALLPPTWRNYRPIQQTYWAGKVGRGLFRIHGSGESPDFFSGKDKNYPNSYNWNPTIGCLSARELYTEKGKLIQADMPKILDTLKMVGGKNFAGYLIVVDVPTDGKPSEMKEPVSLKMLEGAIATNLTKAQPKSKSQAKSKAQDQAQKSVRSSAKIHSQKVSSQKASSQKTSSKQSIQRSQLALPSTSQLANHSSNPNHSSDLNQARIIQQSKPGVKQPGVKQPGVKQPVVKQPGVKQPGNGSATASKDAKSGEDGKPLPIAY